MSPFAYRRRSYQRTLIEPLEKRSHFSVGTDLGWASALSTFSNGSVVSAAVAPDGKLVVLSRNWSEADNTTVETLSRFNRDGSLDDSFSVSLSTNTAPTSDAEGTPTRQASDFTRVLVYSDGSIYLAGTTWTEKQVTISYDSIWNEFSSDDAPIETPISFTYSFFQAQDGTDLVVRKLSADGTPDSSFGIQGSSIIDLGGSESLTDIALGRGKLVLLGTSYDSASGGYSGDYNLARLTTDGNLDASFGKGGIAVAPLSDNVGWATNVFVTADGSVLVAGKTYTWDESPWLLPPVIIDPVVDDTADKTDDSARDGSTDTTDGSTDAIDDYTTTDDFGDTSDDFATTDDSTTTDDFGDDSQTDFPTDDFNIEESDTSDVDPSTDDSSFPTVTDNQIDQGEVMPVDPIPTFCIAYPPAMRTTTLTVARFSPNGQLDSSYGNNGLATADISSTATPLYGSGRWCGGWAGRGGWGQLTIENISVDSNGQLTFSSASLSQGSSLSSKPIQFAPSGSLLDSPGSSVGGSASLSLGIGLSVAFNFDGFADGVLSDDDTAALSQALTPPFTPDGYPGWYCRYPVMFAMSDSVDGSTIRGTMLPPTTEAVSGPAVTEANPSDSTPPTIPAPAPVRAPSTDTAIATQSTLATPTTSSLTPFSKNLIDELDPQSDLLTSSDQVLA